MSWIKMIRFLLQKLKAIQIKACSLFFSVAQIKQGKNYLKEIVLQIKDVIILYEYRYLRTFDFLWSIAKKTLLFFKDFKN